MGPKLGGCAPFGEGELRLHLTQCGLVEDHLDAKFHLHPSNRLATMDQRYRQDRTDIQRSDSIGRTVLQTVAQKQHTEMWQRYAAKCQACSQADPALCLTIFRNVGK